MVEQGLAYKEVSVREKIKMVLYIWKKLKEELDEIVELSAVEGYKLTKTEVVSKALEKELTRLKAEILSKNLTILRDVDVNCFAEKMLKLRQKLNHLTEERYREITGRAAPEAYRGINQIGLESKEYRELLKIQRFINIYGESWDRDVTLYLILLAIKDCKAMRRCKEENSRMEDVLERYFF